VAGQHHRHALGDAGTDQIADRASAHIVRDPAGAAGRRARDPPHRRESFDRLRLLRPWWLIATIATWQWVDLGFIRLRDLVGLMIASLPALIAVTMIGAWSYQQRDEKVA